MKLNVKFTVTAALAAAVIIIGTLLCVLGFGLGTDFTGGSGVRVVYEDDITQAQYDSLKKGITETLKSVGLKANNAVPVKFADEFQGIEFTFPSKIKNKKFDEKTGEALGTLLVDGAGGLSEAQKQTLKDYLGSGFNFESVKTVTSVAGTASALNAEIGFYKVSPTPSASRMFLYVALGAGIALLASAVYCGFRFCNFGFEKNKFLNGLRSALSLILNALVALALAFALSIILAVVFAVPVQSSFSAALLIALLSSVASAMFTLNILQKEVGAETENPAAAAAAKSLPALGILAAVFTIAMLVLRFAAAAFTGSFVISTAAGLIAAVFSSVFILPYIWRVLKFRHVKSKAKEKTEETE